MEYSQTEDVQDLFEVITGGKESLKKDQMAKDIKKKIKNVDFSTGSSKFLSYYRFWYESSGNYWEVQG